jgi:hypothetical protein
MAIFSLDASLVMYTNRTINPPRKIRNSTKENHLILMCKKIVVLIARVCARIRMTSITGWLAKKYNVDVVIIIMAVIVISKFSLNGNFNFGS